MCTVPPTFQTISAPVGFVKDTRPALKAGRPNPRYGAAHSFQAASTASGSSSAPSRLSSREPANSARSSALRVRARFSSSVASCVMRSLYAQSQDTSQRVREKTVNQRGKPRTALFRPWALFTAGRREKQTTGYGVRDTGFAIHGGGNEESGVCAKQRHEP